MRKSPLILTGMHGLGDNLHIRAIVRQLIENHEIWLQTSWVSVFHDFLPELHVTNKTTILRTQTKNAIRESTAFSIEPAPRGTPTIKIWYPPTSVKQHGGVLAAMMVTIKECSIDTADFRLPIPAAWDLKVLDLIEKLNPSKPIMIYRPLTERKEWNGSRARNPDRNAYRDLFYSIREDYFVISIADLLSHVEWETSLPIYADAQFHAGELPFEMLAPLFRRATLVYGTSGFATILAQAVGTPVVGIFGTYEMGYSFSAGARFSPSLWIEPIKPQDGFSHGLFDKSIDIPVAEQRLEAFSATIIADRYPRISRD